MPMREASGEDLGSAGAAEQLRGLQLGGQGEHVSEQQPAAAAVAAVVAAWVAEAGEDDLR
jgi:hypothetical protein